MTKKCPKCGSTNIKWFGVPQTRSKWECKDCGYVGALVIDDGKAPDFGWRIRRDKGVKRSSRSEGRAFKDKGRRRGR